MQMLWYEHIEPYIPNMTQLKARLIASYWREFWENPDRFKGTNLPKIISDWVETEVKNGSYNEWGEFRRLGR